MSNNKNIAVILGVVAGAVLVSAAVTMYTSKHQVETQDINAVLEQARKTVKKINDAVESVKSSAT